jgi:hypothetical protein
LKLWTIQDPEVWKILQNEGVIYAEWSRVDPDFEKPYRWLVQQMGMSDTHPPIWAWYWYPDSKTGKPDLRKRQGGYPGQANVLLELEVPDDLVTLHDYMSWHSVLNNSMIYPDGSEEWSDARWDAYVEANEPFSQKEIEDSWQRIFNTYRLSFRYIQATFPYLKLTWVRSAREFISR